MRKEQLYFFSFFSFCLLILGCRSEVNSPFDGPDFEVETVFPTGDEKYLQLDADYLFDEDKLPTIHLSIPGSSLAKIDADPVAEEYIEGSMTFEGETISPVGIRYKGSFGAFAGCTSGINFLNPSGRKTCTKLSMKIKINWGDREERFYGLNKIQLHSMNQDPSQMRDRLGYWMFREMGVKAPRCVHAKLMINGKFAGLFALVEQIDGRFTKHNFEDGDGNLYKEIWPIDMHARPFTEEEYLQALKTNEDENPSVELIKSFGEEIQSTPPTELKPIVEKWMDVENIMTYIAVDRTIRNDDGAFHWYCFGGECASHNFYWYEETDRQKLHLIPWDLDHAFENIGGQENAITGVMDDWGEITNNCEPYGSLLGFKQRSAACDKLTGAWVKFDDLFEQKRIEFKEGPLSANEVEEKLQKWSEQIQFATEEAALDFDDALDVNKWEFSVEDLKNKLEFARNN